MAIVFSDSSSDVAMSANASQPATEAQAVTYELFGSGRRIPSAIRIQPHQHSLQGPALNVVIMASCLPIS